MDWARKARALRTIGIDSIEQLKARDPSMSSALKQRALHELDFSTRERSNEDGHWRTQEDAPDRILYGGRDGMRRKMRILRRAVRRIIAIPR